MTQNSCCGLCKSSTDDELHFGQLLTLEDRKFHHYCLLFGPGLPQNGRDEEGVEGFLAKDIEKEISRIKRLKCFYCNQFGANLGCCIKKCPKAFHTECGIKRKAIFQFKHFINYCNTHKKIRQVEKFKRLDAICSICFDPLKKVYPESILIPCCKNSWFHKDCLQRFALTSGSNFKCPLCGDKDMDDLANLGIFFPERDALWEYEENAFEELYRPLNLTCEEPICSDRKKNAEDITQWKVCDYCGSKGVHYECLRSDPNKRYTCIECKTVIEKPAKKAKSFISKILGESDVSSSDEE